MAKKTLGYVELEWTCKRCGTINPGTQKTCLSCGAAMSEADQFDLPEQQDLIEDPEVVEKAAKGADLHCPYCGARNPAGAETCSQCGADLTEAVRRESGKVLGAYSDQPVEESPCPSCEQPNPANAAFCRTCGANLKPAPAAAPPQSKAEKKPRRGLAIGATLLVVLLCAAALVFLYLGSRTTDLASRVESVGWERSIQIMEQQPVEHEDWRDELPSDAQDLRCTDKLRHTQEEPEPGAREVCGTPYTVDQGSGVGEVVQDCVYQIYEPWCSYTIEEWVVVDSAVLQGSDLNAAWPAPALLSHQREGERSEKYWVNFLGGDQTYKYTTEDAFEFSQFSPRSEWLLEVNTFGHVTGVRPTE